MMIIDKYNYKNKHSNEYTIYYLIFYNNKIPTYITFSPLYSLYPRYVENIKCNYM